MHSYNNFKILLKQQIIDKYKDICDRNRCAICVIEN